jgi:hypothetical protein
LVLSLVPAFVFTIPAPTVAGLIPISSAREVSAEAVVEFPGGSSSAQETDGVPDLDGPFLGNASATAGGANLDASASASQDSLIEQLALSGFGGASVSARALEAGLATATARSVFEVEFEVDADYQFLLTGQLSVFTGSLDANALASIRLSSDGADIAFAEAFFSDLLDFEYSGLLEPGQSYALQALVTADAFGLPFGAALGGFAFDLALEPVSLPEPHALVVLGLSLASIGRLRSRRDLGVD